MKTRADGIYVSKRGKKWVVSGIVGGDSTYLGTFDNEQDARDFADHARKELNISPPRSRRGLDPYHRLAQIKKRLRNKK